MDAKSVANRSHEGMEDELAMDKPKSTARRHKPHVVETLPRSVAEEELRNTTQKCTHAAPEPVQSSQAGDLSHDIDDHAPAPADPVDHALALDVAAMLSQMQPMPSPQTISQAVVQILAPVVQKKQKSKDNELVSSKETAALKSDDLVIGLPKEQYKPRPSRSRSTRIVEDNSIDYSKRPEKAATSKLKRRKTTNEVSLGSPTANVDAYKVAQIGSMGFTPRQTKAALEESSGNIDRAIDCLLAQSSGNKENSPSMTNKTRSKSTKQPTVTTTSSEFLAVKVTQGSGDKTFHPTDDNTKFPKKNVPEVHEKEKDFEGERGLDSAPVPTTNSAMEKLFTKKRRRDKVVDSDEEDEIIAELEPSLAAPKPASKRKVVDSDVEDDFINDFVAEVQPLKPMPKATTKRTKSLPAKKAQATADRDDLDITALTQPSKEPRRGRGRPKRAIETVVEAEPAEPTVAEPTKQIDSITPPKSPGPEEFDVDIEQPMAQPQNPTSTVKDGVIPPSTPEQHSGSSQKSAAVKITVQHSPLNKSTMPLRVGLSRKKRIAPLLKIIRK